MTRFFTTRTRLAATAAGTVALVGGTVAATAAVIDPYLDGQGQYGACVTTKTGEMRMVVAGTGCKNGEIKVTWNERGPQGEQGIQGVQGVQGQRGEPGATGEPGQQGPVGPRGFTGATGAPGPKGDAGAPGLSGLEIVNGHADVDLVGGWVTARCPEGKKVVTGGFSELDSDVQSSEMLADLSGWHAFATGGLFGGELFVHATCAWVG